MHVVEPPLLRVRARVRVRVRNPNPNPNLGGAVVRALVAEARVARHWPRHARPGAQQVSHGERECLDAGQRLLELRLVLVGERPEAVLGQPIGRGEAEVRDHVQVGHP